MSMSTRTRDRATGLGLPMQSEADASKPKAMLSFKTEDKEIVDELCDFLEENGYRTWRFDRDAEGGVPYIDDWEDQLEDTACVVGILTELSVKSEQVKDELRSAVRCRREGKALTVIPIKYDDCDLPKCVRNYHALDFSPANRPPDWKDKLLRSMPKPAPERTSRPPSAAPAPKRVKIRPVPARSWKSQPVAVRAAIVAGALVLLAALITGIFTLPPIVRTDPASPGGFTLAIQVFSEGHAEIAVKNVPEDAQGPITYFKNSEVLAFTTDTSVIDRDVETGGFHSYAASVFGEGGIVHSTDTAYSIESELVFIKGGEFLMGSESGSAYGDERPVHPVRVRDFFIGRYEVTQAQYEAVMGVNPSRFVGATNPVERVSWDDAVAFCAKLSEWTGRRYTLPSEAQWEYACRAGSTTDYCFGNSEDELGQYAWYGANSGAQSGGDGTEP